MSVTIDGEVLNRTPGAQTTGSKVYVAFHFVRNDGAAGTAGLLLTGLDGLQTQANFAKAVQAIKQQQGCEIVTPISWWSVAD